MPACALLIRHHFPLFSSLKQRLHSRYRVLTDRFSSRARSPTGSKSRGFLSLDGSKSSVGGQHPEAYVVDGGGKVVVLGKLPEIAKGMHHMRTARSFIWGGRKYDTTIDTLDEEEYYYHGQNFRQAVGNV